ncbi:hypothetical protein [Lachnospira multipara]|uniref:hypothetical protein n=1 Tax=Lachnospira multipara TaxID=28051 RepID=UPI0012DD8262|nr:hypothetical protein [Lachnospira multipara]
MENALRVNMYRALPGDGKQAISDKKQTIKVNDKSKRQTINTNDNDKQQTAKEYAILEYLGRVDKAKTVDIAAVIGLGPDRTRIILASMVKRNMIVAEGANRVRTEIVEYIMSVQDNVYFFQRILKHSIMMKKRITLGDTICLDQGERSIVINSTPDAIYVKDDDILYFKKLSTISPIFKGIDELYREAT